MTQYIVEASANSRRQIRRGGRCCFTTLDTCDNLEDAEAIEAKAWDTKLYTRVQIRVVG